MHRRNHSLDLLAGVIGGGGREGTSGGGGFSYGTTPPLTQAPTAAQQAKLQQEKQKYKERHQHLLSHGEFSQSAESLNQQQETVLTPMSSTTTLSTVNSRTQTYPPGRDSVAGNGRRDSSHFPPTPPASIRVASPAGTPRGHAHSGSQQSTMSNRGPTSRSSTPISLNVLFSSGGMVGAISGQGAAQGGKKQKSATSSKRSRFTFSTLIGGGGDKDRAHGRQASIGSQQPQPYLQHLLQEEERLQQADTPLPLLPPPTSPAQREREWADQSDRNSIRRRSVNSAYSESGRRTPTSPDEIRKGLASAVGTSLNTWTEDGAAGSRRNSSLSTVHADDTPIVYDQDVDMSQIEELIGAHSPIESDTENSDAGGSTPTSITPSLFKRNRKELEGTGIATGESTMLGDVVYVDGKLVRLNGSGSAMTMASMGSIRGSIRSIDNFPLLPTQQQFLRVEDRETISPLRQTSMELPLSSPSSQASVESGLAATAAEVDPVKRSTSCSSTMSQVKRKPSPVTASVESGLAATAAEVDPVKRSTSCSSTMSQVKRKPSPVTASFPPPTAQAGSSTPSTPLPSVVEPDTSKTPSPPPQAPLPAPPIITTSAAPSPPHSNPITNMITSPLTNNSGETAVPTTWGGRQLQMEVSQVELPPPPPHTRSPLPDSPISAQYVVERKKKLIDEEWEDLEHEDPGDGDAPPPPYVARMSMTMNSAGGEGPGMSEDEKAMLIRAGMMHRRSLPGMPLPRRSALHEETVESLNAGKGAEVMENDSQENLDSQTNRPPTIAIPSARADIENKSERRSSVEDQGAFGKGDSDGKATAPTRTAKPSQRTTPKNPSVSTATKTRSNPTSAANSPTVARKRTILKKPGATPKLSTNLARSNTRNKLRFSHVAPEVVVPSLPISLDTSPSPDASNETKGKQCKTCKSITGGSLANKYRELLTRERESFTLERLIWEEERKGYEKKVADLERRLRKLVEVYVLARGDEGGDDEDAVEENTQQNTAEEEEAEEQVDDMQPVMSATVGLSVNTPASGNSTRKNSFRDTGKEVDRSCMNQPSSDRSGVAWPHQAGLPTPPSTGAIDPFSRPPATVDTGPTSSGRNQYWNNFLDDHRTAPTTRATGSGSNHGYRASASSSSWGGASQTWGGADSSSNMGGWVEAGSHTYGGWGHEDPDPRMKLPITEERAVYARLYAEASIGIGGPTGELLH
ncbi:hypothetical protein BGX38DRAFT_1280318 [Terfezia claveryi]|nr:hypothetical protein BGX38DRAFT_1280318 [Terfezia claveryi]